jgi:hypothetical protein
VRLRLAPGRLARADERHSRQGFDLLEVRRGQRLFARENQSTRVSPRAIKERVAAVGRRG